MSTRGSIGIIYKDKYLSCYSHCDSYPEGAGEDVVNFITKINAKGTWEKFKKAIEKVQGVSAKDIPSKEIQEKYQNLGYCNLGVSRQTPEEWYCLLRNIQGIDMFAEIYKGKLKHVLLANDFIKDSVFCEYAYIINLDTMKFEVYRGFQEKPQPDNRFGVESNRDGRYYPCRKVVEFYLKRIPKSWIKIFNKNLVEGY